MIFTVGEEIVLLEDYSNYSKGTKGLYCGHTLHSGYLVPLMVIPNDDYRKLLQDNGAADLVDLVEIRSKIFDESYLRTYLPHIKPDENMISSVSKAEADYLSAKEALSKAETVRELVRNACSDITVKTCPDGHQYTTSKG